MSTLTASKDAQWIEHKYLNTYRIANRVQAVACNYTSYLRELEALAVDDGIRDFVPHWRKDTALHKFIRYIADEMFDEDNSGKYKIPFGDDPAQPRWTIPIEADLVTYGLRQKIEFEIPKIPPIERRSGNIVRYEDAPEIADACWGHFREMRWSQLYKDLLYRVSEEVFYVMFINRVTLQCLHEYLASYVTELGSEVVEGRSEYFTEKEWEEEYGEVMRCYTKSGTIRRTRIPKWARRAVFFRDRGLCVQCRKDLSGLVNRFNVENYDHMVPLAKGGLNDVTNLQLLCESCNKSKLDRPQLASEIYQRWY